MQEVYQKEAEALGMEKGDMAEETLTPYQRSLLAKIRAGDNGARTERC